MTWRAEKTVRYILVVLIVLLQYPLWFGDGSLINVWRLKREINIQKTENTRLRERNRTLEAEVTDLKHGLEALEERARSELGMVKKGETFFHVMEDKPADIKK